MERREEWLSRRQFVLGVGAAGLGVLAGCGRLPWQAPARVPRIGFLMPISRDAPIQAKVADAFVRGLRDLGYQDGQNIHIDYRYSEGNDEQLADLAAELVRIPVDVIVTGGTPNLQAARKATTTIPIVFGATGHPLASGGIASLMHPGGNVTGVSVIDPRQAATRLELLRAAAGGPSRVAILWRPGNPSSALSWEETAEAARPLGVELQSWGVDSLADLPGVLEAANRDHVEALMVFNDARFYEAVTPIVRFAEQTRLPTMYGDRTFVEAGGLMAYGARWIDSWQQAAYYVGRILNGAKPADLPVQQPARFDFVVNQNTAAALGITFPPELMLQVTEVIQ
jgi:putative ABC transport system substrate-binding protein